MTSNSSKAFCLAGLGLALMLGTTGASFAQEIVLGAVVPSSGPFAEWGRANTTTLQMLEKQVNGSGGINGAKLRIAILDDATKPAQATNDLRKLAGDDKVLAVAGPLTSSAAEVTFPVANEMKIVSTSQASSKPGVAKLNRPWAFRNTIDEGVLGRTLNVGFGRSPEGVPENADRLYAPLRIRLGEREITGIFRDHYLSDLVGFVYSRMDSAAAADDLHRRIRMIAERAHSRGPLSLPLILDGENAWEYYPGNGREFLRRLYGRIAADSEIRALTVSEALREAGEIATVRAIAAGSWINANFDVWIGHKEDVTAWELLARAREFYGRQLARRQRGEANAPTDEQLAAALEALLMAEGSDWCWWFGPEHSSANDAEFDAFFRQLLSEAYQNLGRAAPDKLAEPIKQRPAPAHVEAPSGFLDVRVDGRESTYFEWLGAALYSPERKDSSMHGRVHWLRQFRYGFSKERFFVRVDFVDDALAAVKDGEVRITLRGEEEVRIVLQVREGKLRGQHVETKDTCLWGPQEIVLTALDRILEISVGRKLVRLGKRNSFSMVIALWEGGLPVDLLPAEGWFEVPLGDEHFAWGA